MASPLSGTLGAAKTLRPPANQYYILTSWKGTRAYFTDGTTQVELDPSWLGDRLILTNTAYVITDTGSGLFAYSGSIEDIVN